MFLGRLLEQGFYADRKALLEELNHLVRNNYLYYNPTLAEYKLQGRSMEIGLNRFMNGVREIVVFGGVIYNAISSKRLLLRKSPVHLLFWLLDVET